MTDLGVEVYRCDECGKSETQLDRQFSRCSKFHMTRYCGRPCQLQAWKRHKISCKGNRQGRDRLKALGPMSSDLSSMQMLGIFDAFIASYGSVLLRATFEQLGLLQGRVGKQKLADNLEERLRLVVVYEFTTVSNPSLAKAASSFKLDRIMLSTRENVARQMPPGSEDIMETMRGRDAFAKEKGDMGVAWQLFLAGPMARTRACAIPPGFIAHANAVGGECPGPSWTTFLQGLIELGEGQE